MSIADKLTYLNTTKQLLKTEINKINNVLDDNSAFRSYPQELFNGYLDILNNGTDTLWDNLEKVSQTGTEIVLENVETAPMKIELSGNTSQETTTGKNLFDGIFRQGDRFTTGLTNSKRLFTTNNIEVKKDTTYTISTTLDIATFRYAINISRIPYPISTSQSSQQFYDSGWKTTGSFTFTPTEDGYLGIIISKINDSDLTPNDISAYIWQLEKGSTATPYEQFSGGLPSPSPDYPQEVKVVTGNNTISIESKNYFEGTLYNGQIGSNGGFSSSTSRITNVTNAISSETFLEAGTYKLEIDGLDFATLLTKDENNTIIENFANSWNALPFEFTLTKGGKLYFTGRKSDNSTISTEDYSAKIFSSKTEYPINLTTKNLFDKDNANILNAWINANTKLITSSISNRTIWIEVESNTTYKVKKIADTSSNGRFRVGTSPNLPVVGGTLAQVIQDDTAEEITITTGANDKYIAVFCYSTSSSITLEEILDSLEIKEANISYAEMCKIGDYKDYFHKDSGKWYVHKEIKKIVLNGSEDWNYTNNVFYLRYSMDTSSIAHLRVQNYVPYSNNFKGVINYHNTGQFYSNSQNNNFGLNLDAIQHNIYVRYDSITSTEDFKTWLSTHNTEVYYPLATPTEEEITNTTLIEQLEAISKAKSVKDKTYITQTNDELPFILDIQAIKEYNVE